MPKKIIWAPLAESDFSSILEYLNKNWDSRSELEILRIYDTRRDPDKLKF